MKRNMNLIREMLLAIEGIPSRSLYDLGTDPIEGYDMPELQEHLRLLEQAGFVDRVSLTRSGGCCGGLTWVGHEFLDAARAPSVWAKAQQKVSSIGGAVSFEVMKALLIQTAKDQLGLS